MRFYNNNLEKNGSFRNKENLQYKKTADLVLLGLLVRTNGKCYNAHVPWHRLKRYSPNIPEGPEYEKNINTISMHLERFHQLHTETTKAVATSK